MSSRRSSNVFANTHTELLNHSITSTSLAAEQLLASNLTRAFPATTLGLQLTQVAKVIKARDVVGAERDAFFVRVGGFDSHDDLFDTTDAKFAEVNEAVAAFVAEMKADGAWDDVLLVQASEL